MDCSSNRLFREMIPLEYLDLYLDSDMFEPCMIFPGLRLEVSYHWTLAGYNEQYMMSWSNGNLFRVTGPLCGEFIGRRWIPPHKGQWRGALMFSLIGAWIISSVNNGEAGDLRYHRAYDVTVKIRDKYDVLILRPVYQILCFVQWYIFLSLYQSYIISFVV